MIFSTRNHLTTIPPLENAGLFHAKVQFPIFGFSMPLPVGKTGVFNNSCPHGWNYRLEPLQSKGSRRSKILA